MFFVVRSNDSLNFPLGLIKYIAIVIVIIIMLIVSNVSIINILHPATPAMRNTYARPSAQSTQTFGDSHIVNKVSEATRIVNN